MEKSDFLRSLIVIARDPKKIWCQFFVVFSQDDDNNEAEEDTFYYTNYLKPTKKDPLPNFCTSFINWSKPFLKEPICSMSAYILYYDLNQVWIEMA